MTPIYLNSVSNIDRYKEHQFLSPSDHHNQIQIPSPNSQASSSSNSPTCHLFFNPTTIHDQDALFHRDSHDPSQNEDDNFGSHAYLHNRVENQDERVRSNDGLKFSLWKRETYDHMDDENNQVKLRSSKTRVMLKMKKTNPMKLHTLQSTGTEMKLEDHMEQPSFPTEENTNSNSTNSTSSNNNIPIRACSDCNTTKTPLWRSGPQGPKSLCNACGIRQRKARKAMAAAAAETSRNVFIEKPTSLKATKILRKDQKKTNHGHITKYKKRQFTKQINKNQLPSSTSPAVKKNCVEEFLISLRKNLAFHGVFPQDEKEAAILLMALSCGYVHQ